MVWIWILVLQFHDSKMYMRTIVVARTCTLQALDQKGCVHMSAFVCCLRYSAAPIASLSSFSSSVKFSESHRHEHGFMLLFCRDLEGVLINLHWYYYLWYARSQKKRKPTIVHIYCVPHLKIVVSTSHFLV